MTKWTPPAIAFAAFILVTGSAQAVAPLPAEELADHCKAFPEQIESGDGQYCVRYIQGFIDGAVATDARVMLSVEAEYERKETFSERAFRTRGRDRNSNDRAARYAGYCLGEPIPLREVVEKVVEDLYEDVRTNSGGWAREVVYASLRKNYPCEPTAQDD